MSEACYCSDLPLIPKIMVRHFHVLDMKNFKTCINVTFITTGTNDFRQVFRGFQSGNRISVMISNMAQVIEFYRDKLGLKLTN